MGYREPEYYFEKYLKSNKPFEKKCLHCGRIFNIRDYHPIHFSKMKFCCSSCAGGYAYAKRKLKMIHEKDLLLEKRD